MEIPYEKPLTFSESLTSPGSAEPCRLAASATAPAPRNTSVATPQTTVASTRGRLTTKSAVSPQDVASEHWGIHHGWWIITYGYMISQTYSYIISIKYTFGDFCLVLIFKHQGIFEGSKHMGLILHPSHISKNRPLTRDGMRINRGNGRCYS